MNLYLVIVFLASAGYCASHDVQKTPDQIFTEYFAVARLRTRTRSGKTNITAIITLLKNGTDVADKIKGVFEEAQKLQNGSVSAKEVLQLAEDAYKAGKEAYEVGKQAVEVGKEVFGATKGFLDKHKNLLEVGKTMGKTLAKIGKMLGPALGAVGIAFALIDAFVPAAPSPELEAIQNGFKEMNTRFDQVSNQINLLDKKMDFYKAIEPYEHVRNNLENVYTKYLSIIEDPKSAAFKDEFRAVCKDHSVEPRQALKKLHRIIVNRGLEGQPHMIKTVIEQHKLDYKIIMGWFESITQDAYTLAMLRSACFGALYNNETDSGHNYTLNQAGTWVTEIIKVLEIYEEKVTNFDGEFIHVFKNELENLPDNTDPTAENELNGRCDVVEANLTGSNAVCRGDPEVNAKRIAVNHHLNSKFFWFNWLVMVYEKPENDPDVPCNTPPGTHWLLIKKDPHVFVAWSRKNAFEAARLRQNAQEFLGDRMKGFHPAYDGFTADDISIMGIFKVVKAITGKETYNTFFNIKMMNWIRDWMKTEPYTNKTWCSFGGGAGKYHRSITTSGIAAHAVQAVKSYTIDYLVLFW